MPPLKDWPNPLTTRSLVMLQIAAELVSGDDLTFMQAKVLLRGPGSKDWKLSLYAAGAFDSVDAVVNGDVHVSTINPSAGLMLAHRGMGPYDKPQPVRTVGVIPSLDQCVFACRSDTGLATFEDIAVRRFPLRVSLRGQREHCMNLILKDIAAAAGFSLDDLQDWGGGARYEGLLPWPESEKFRALLRGDIDAIFDEAAYV